MGIEQTQPVSKGALQKETLKDGTIISYTMENGKRNIIASQHPDGTIITYWPLQPGKKQQPKTAVQGGYQVKFDRDGYPEEVATPNGKTVLFEQRTISVPIGVVNTIDRIDTQASMHVANVQSKSNIITNTSDSWGPHVAEMERRENAPTHTTLDDVVEVVTLPFTIPYEGAKKITREVYSYVKQKSQ